MRSRRRKWQFERSVRLLSQVIVWIFILRLARTLCNGAANKYNDLMFSDKHQTQFVTYMSVCMVLQLFYAFPHDNLGSSSQTETARISSDVSEIEVELWSEERREGGPCVCFFDVNGSHNQSKA